MSEKCCSNELSVFAKALRSALLGALGLTDGLVFTRVKGGMLCGIVMSKASSLVNVS